jgi:hypothetical protein
MDMAALDLQGRAGEDWATDLQGSVGAEGDGFAKWIGCEKRTPVGDGFAKW